MKGFYIHFPIVLTLPFREIQKSINSTGFIRCFRTLWKTDLANVYKTNVFPCFSETVAGNSSAPGIGNVGNMTFLKGFQLFLDTVFDQAFLPCREWEMFENPTFLKGFPIVSFCHREMLGNATFLKVFHSVGAGGPTYMYKSTNLDAKSASVVDRLVRCYQLFTNFGAIGLVQTGDSWPTWTPSWWPWSTAW